MNKLLTILLFLLCIGMLSCSHSDETNEFSNDPDLKPLKKEIQEQLSSQKHLILGLDTITFSDTLQSIYRKRGFEPLWFEAKKKIQLKENAIHFFANTKLYGLDSNLFYISYIRDTLSNWKKDVLLTRNYIMLLSIMKHGVIKTKSFAIDSLLSHCSIPQQTFTLPTWEFKEWESLIASNEPQNEYYKRLKKEIAVFSKMKHLTDTTFEFADLKEDSSTVYDQAKNALIYHNYLSKTKKNDTATLLAAIKKFQHKNGLTSDALLGKYSQKALNKSHFDRWVQLAVNLERSRANTIDEEEYIYVNIPNYKLRWIKGDTIFREHKVITGAYETQTPEFHAQLRSIILYPTWHVPFSISTKEILPALRRDTNYLAKKGYSLHTPGGDSVSPAGIEWNRYSENYFPFRIRQTGGKSNSLGVIKFLFPNEHFVYLHDTPGKYLFRNNIRAYSHGCIRLENPLEFGAALIEREIDTNLITVDSLSVLIDSAITQVYPIRKKITVYIDYKTIDPFESKETIYHTDIYDRDQQWWERMKYQAVRKKETQIAEM